MTASASRIRASEAAQLLGQKYGPDAARVMLVREARAGMLDAQARVVRIGKRPFGPECKTEWSIESDAKLPSEFWIDALSSMTKGESTLVVEQGRFTVRYLADWERNRYVLYIFWADSTEAWIAAGVNFDRSLVEDLAGPESGYRVPHTGEIGSSAGANEDPAYGPIAGRDEMIRDFIRQWPGNNYRPAWEAFQRHPKLGGLPRKLFMPPWNEEKKARKSAVSP